MLIGIRKYLPSIFLPRQWTISPYSLFATTDFQTQCQAISIHFFWKDMQLLDTCWPYLASVNHEFCCTHCLHYMPLSVSTTLWRRCFMGHNVPWCIKQLFWSCTIVSSIARYPLSSCDSIRRDFPACRLGSFWLFVLVSFCPESGGHNSLGRLLETWLTCLTSDRP